MQLEHGTWELRLGDCLDPETGLASLESVDHIVTDPPYDQEAHSAGRRVKRRGTVKGKRPDGCALDAEPLPFAPLADRNAVAAALTLASRWIIVFCQAEAVGSWRAELEFAGAVWKRAAIWVKPDGAPQLTGDRPAMGYESIAMAHAKGRSRWNGGGKHGVYRFVKNIQGSRRPQHHPTEKPIALMETLVRDFTDPGDLICDPFAGSGTTGVACIRLGRRFIGWEKDLDYHTKAVRRLGAVREQTEIFERPAKPKQKKLEL